MNFATVRIEWQDGTKTKAAESTVRFVDAGRGAVRDAVAYGIADALTRAIPGNAFSAEVALNVAAALAEDTSPLEMGVQSREYAERIERWSKSA